MKGCFGCFKLIQTIISTIVIGIIGFIVLFPCGGLNYIKNYVDSKLHPTKSNIQARAQELGDFSNIPKEYELTRVVNMLGANAVIAEHKTTNQKMALLDAGTFLKLTKNDVNSTAINGELKKLATRLDNMPVKLSSLEVGQKGSFKAFNQDIPYVKVKIKVTGNVNKSMEGIIGVIDNPENKNKLVISGSEIGKYKQDVAEKYFKSVKINTEKTK